MNSSVELSVVIPCLNEAETLGICIRKAQAGIQSCGLPGEVIVADNGSEDGSIQIAEELQARVIHATEKGYGNALAAGIAAARGEYVIMGDADDSYDFLEIPSFVSKLQDGFDLVQGCRLPGGGGKIMPGAMPPSHRWLGNPLFSLLARLMFRSRIHDIYCGLRGFRKSTCESLHLRCSGMEFATEMIIKATLQKAKIAEIPITLHCDGRKSRAPHLRTMRDGWRTLRFFLLLSPGSLFLTPGLFLIALGIVGYGVALPGLRFGHVVFDAHTLLFASLAIIMGYQTVFFSIFARTYAINTGLLPGSRKMELFFQHAYLERGLLLGLVALLAGAALLSLAVARWWAVSFGNLNYAETMRKVIPGVMLVTLGYQTILSSFLVSMLGMRHR